MTQKTVLTVVSILAAMQSIAQPTLTASTTSPIVGDKFYGHTLDTTGKQKGASGANVTWTVTGAATAHDTITYLACGATPNCSSFPGSDLVGYNNSEYTYYTADASALSIIGADASGDIINLTDPLKVLSYPTTYMSTMRDTGYAVVNAGIVQVYIWTMNTTTADAWGTLTTPAGTYTNVMRLHTTSITKDSVDLMGMPQVNYNETETYGWYAAGFHNALMTMTYDTSGTGTSHVTDVKYYTGTGSTAVNEAMHSPQISLQVYPSPAADHIDIKWDGINDDLVSIVLTDMTGKMMASIEYTNRGDNANTITLPVNTYANGVYLLSIRGKSQSLTQKVVVNR